MLEVWCFVVCGYLALALAIGLAWIRWRFLVCFHCACPRFIARGTSVWVVRATKPTKYLPLTLAKVLFVGVILGNEVLYCLSGAMVFVRLHISESKITCQL